MSCACSLFSWKMLGKNGHSFSLKAQSHWLSMKLLQSKLHKALACGEMLFLPHPPPPLPPNTPLYFLVLQQLFNIW